LKQKEDLVQKHNVDFEIYDNEAECAFLDTIEYFISELVPNLIDDCEEHKTVENIQTIKEDREKHKCMNSLLGNLTFFEYRANLENRLISLEMPFA